MTYPTQKLYDTNVDAKVYGPTTTQTNQFHKYFKAKLETLHTVLTFYQQLYAQGKNYGIHLLPLTDISTDVDLCPVDVSRQARNAMMIALYQKLQDPDCVSLDFKNAQNFITAYASISDGFSVLYQLI